MLVYLVEDSAMVRERLCAKILEIDSIIQVSEATSAVAAISGIVGRRPEIVVLDIKLEGGSGLDVLRGVRAALPDMIVIVFTNHVDILYRRRLLKMGADHFFDKTKDFNMVIEVITRMAKAHSVDTGSGAGR